METFFLAMVLNQGAQRKAQEEIDKLLCGSRLPTMADEHSLPYVGALVKEVMRWHPATPLGQSFAARFSNNSSDRETYSDLTQTGRR